MADFETVKELSREQLEQAAAISGIPVEDVSDTDLQQSVANQATDQQIADIITQAPEPTASVASIDPTLGTNNEAETLLNPDADNLIDSEGEPKDEEFEGEKTVYARLVQGYDHPRGHRRAGFAFANGPFPQELSVNAEQLKALRGDATIEIVDKKEFDRVNKLPVSPLKEGSTPIQQNPEVMPGGEVDDGLTPQRKRRYVSDDPTHVDSPEFDGASERLGDTAVNDPNLPEATGDSTTKPQVNDGPTEVSTDMKLKELATIAAQENVVGAEGFEKPGVKKQAIVDAILANRAENSQE